MKIYLRKEPTTDPLKSSFPELSKKMDVVAYSTLDDVENKNPKARWMWFITCPRKNQKRVMLNCYTWEAEWLEDL